MTSVSTVLLREPLEPQELSLLASDFPRYRFVAQNIHNSLSPENWAQVEVMYGSYLRSEELEQAHRLRWIHVPSGDTHHLCMQQIGENTNLLVTITKSTDVHQVGEFVLAAILGFSKNLFHWDRLQANPAHLEGSHPPPPWNLRGRLLLQVGLGITGSAVAEYCNRMGMRVLGLREPPSFHPQCQKTYAFTELHTLLPSADVVCIALPQGKKSPLIIGRTELHLMKQDAILIVLRSQGSVDEQALVEMSPDQKFRGVVLDALPRDLRSKPSPLFSARNVLLTPHIAPLPEEELRLGFSLFRYNFRRYLREDFARLRYLITEEPLS